MFFSKCIFEIVLHLKLSSKQSIGEDVVMKILVTGASGLLGADVSYLLEQNGERVLKCSLNERPGFINCNFINDEDAFDKLFRLEWDYLIHCAGWRDPDSCEKERDLAFKMNVEVTEKLAKLSKRKKSGMLFISTDYVFSGECSPYSENDERSPVNYYGETKKEAEDRVLALSSANTILRIPTLYGVRAGIDASPLIKSSINAVHSKKDIKIDNIIERYPTFTGDVASAIYKLVTSSLGGVYHFSADEMFTKYGFAKIVAEVLNKSSEHIIPENKIADTLAKRPGNTRLLMSKYDKFKMGKSEPLRSRLKMILKHNVV